MKILATSDLHNPTGELFENLVETVNNSNAEAFILGGDISNGDKEDLERVLDRFSRFKGEKLFVIGNHDLYDLELDFNEKYQKVQQLIESNGFHSLDKHPLIVGDIGFVGNIGWYDYSFRLKKGQINGKIFIDGESYQNWEDIPQEAYQEKTAFIENEDGSLKTGFFQWNDKIYCRVNSDQEIVNMCIRKLDEDIKKVYTSVNKIVATTHHLPFENIVTRRENKTGWSIGNAYMGSEKIGKILAKYGKVKVSLTGHSHVPGYFRNGKIKCYNLSSGKPTLTEINL